MWEEEGLSIEKEEQDLTNNNYYISIAGKAGSGHGCKRGRTHAMSLGNSSGFRFRGGPGMSDRTCRTKKKKGHSEV